MTDAGVSNIDVFGEWVTDFADTAGKEANLSDDWSDPYNLSTDVGKCMDGWENHPEYTFSDNWKQYGFNVNNDRVSIISVVINDPYSNVVFVGHTGILIKCDDYYLFVEKIAFEQPYQVTKVNNMNELLSILSQRPEYFGEEDEAGPFIYNNGEYVA